MAQLLAVAVGLGSLAVYFAAFFYPQIHRKPDFIWSGVGLFYAVVLWFCAGRISGALLLGQGASVALIVGLAWQLGRLRLQAGAPDSPRPLRPPQGRLSQPLSPGWGNGPSRQGQFPRDLRRRDPGRQDLVCRDQQPGLSSQGFRRRLQPSAKSAIAPQLTSSLTTPQLDPGDRNPQSSTVPRRSHHLG